MSTVTADITNNSMLEIPIENVSKTYAVIAIKGKNEKGEETIEYAVKSEDDANKTVEKNPDVVSIVKGPQTFHFPHGNTVGALQDIFNNDKELCKQTNNAIDIKLANRVRSLMLETDSENGELSFEEQEGAIDMRQYVGKDSSSRGRSTMEKIMELLSKMPKDQRELLAARLIPGSGE